MLTKLTNSLVSEVVLDLPAAFGAAEEEEEPAKDPETEAPEESASEEG